MPAIPFPYTPKIQKKINTCQTKTNHLTKQTVLPGEMFYTFKNFTVYMLFVVERVEKVF